VTPTGNRAGMQLRTEPCGVCILRVRREPTGLLIKVITQLDISEGAGHQEVTRTDVNDVVALVRRFIEDFTRAHPQA